ncbi:ABC-type hemin transport system ATPase subunit [Bradyrhizobium sp. LM3.2]
MRGGERSSTIFGSDGDRCNQRKKTIGRKFRQEERPDMTNRRALITTTAALAFAFSVSQAFVSQAHAQKKYDTGATDTEIKIGQTVPFSGAYSGLRQYRQDPGRLFQDDQRSGRHQRPQDQSDPV